MHISSSNHEPLISDPNLPSSNQLVKLVILSEPEESIEIGNNGVAIALIIFSTWIISLTFLLTKIDVIQLSWVEKTVAVLIQTFLYTGLFITAHDAMHGAVSPKYPQLNKAIGSFVLLVYGLFDYDKLLKAHWQHHDHPAGDLDPDFHNGKWTDAVTWYIYFMVRYWSWLRFLGLVTTFHILNRIFHVPEPNLVWFWIIPSLLSSVQLFYFGTFLPHRTPKLGYSDSFRSQSIYRPLWWSFLTCYHFGYHNEHHRFPHLAWWQLPKAI
jgi:beta-carotene/zeaxanthin 4-ketolase